MLSICPSTRPHNIQQASIALEYMWGECSSQTSATKVDAIGEVVPLVVLLYNLHKFHILCFSIEHINEWRQLVEHVDVIIQSRYLKKACWIRKSSEQLPRAWWSRIQFHPSKPSFHPIRQFLHFQYIQSILLMIPGNSLSSSLAKRCLRASIVGKIHPESSLEGRGWIGYTWNFHHKL